MLASRLWLSCFRIVVVLALTIGLSGTALAIQDQPDQSDFLGTKESDEFPGLVEEGEYVSPQFDVEITWTDEWEVGDATDPLVEHAIGGNFDNSVASDPDLGDIVFLVDTESESSVLSLGLSPSEQAFDPEVLLQVVQQESFLTDALFLSEDAELLLADSTDDAIAVVAREAAPNDEHVVYWMTYTDPGKEDFTFWVGLDLYDSDEYERILESVDDDIEVEDQDIFPVFDVDDIVEALDASAEPTAEPTEVPTEVPTEEPTEVPTEEPTEEPTEIPPTEEPVTEEPTEEPIEIIGPVGTPEASPVASPQAADSGSGLLGPGNYLSPQHQVPVTWTQTWEPDPNLDDPFPSFPMNSVDEVHLTDTAGNGVQVYITIEAAIPAFDADTYLDGITQPSYAVNVLGLSPDTTVVTSTSTEQGVAAVYLDNAGEEPIVRILEVHVIDAETIAFVDIQADASLVDESLITSITNEIQVNGMPSLFLLTPADIISAIGDS